MPRQQLLTVDAQVHGESTPMGEDAYVWIPGFDLAYDKQFQVNRECRFIAPSGAATVLSDYELEITDSIPGGIDAALEHPGGDSWNKTLRFENVNPGEERQFWTGIQRKLPDFSGDHAFTVALYQIVP